MQKELSRDVAQHVLNIVDAGLVNGVGKPEPGKMCVEAAVCFALGLPHGDDPPCVGHAVREFKIRLNDSSWSSDAARAKGMRKLAIAQLGSDTIDQVEFVNQIALEAIRQIVPIALRAAASMKYNEPHKKELEKHAKACEKSKNLKDGKAAAAAARDEVLTVMANIGLEALIKCKSPGCQWLDLCD